MAYAMAAIGLLFASNCLGWWLFARSEKVSGALATENNALREGAEVHDRADQVLAKSVASGGRLHSRLLARAQRGLPEPGTRGGTPATTGAEPAGGRGAETDSAD